MSERLEVESWKLEAVSRWLAALEQRHLATLTFSEVARALRALSSTYVERREKLARGGALDSAGKRAAFALFYGPQHFLIVREIVRALNAAGRVTRITDLGCGTGTSGAALALETNGASVDGLDRNRWAVEEANWTYRALGIAGTARVGDISQMARLKPAPTAGRTILAAYSVNELDADAQGELLRSLLAAQNQGAAVLIVEPIARRANRWWDTWREALTTTGGREDEWRFPVPLPMRQLALAKAAGLDPRELTARSLYVPSRPPR